MTSDLQRDVELIDLHFRLYAPKHMEAWQRIRQRLTPDRERVARAMYEAIWHHPSWEHADQYDWLVCADAAINAMGEP